jgi:saccharopine dehydrogenase-like NADP-dependent oxidoreductase
MARTTGYTATVVARMVLDGTYEAPGISPPEYLGRETAHLERLLAELGERGVEYREAPDT